MSNHTVAALHGEPLVATLQKAGYTSHLISVSDGEEYKNFETVLDLYNQLLELRVDRGDLIVALGGGVIGDIVGFIASTYMRGLPLIQIPTSLLAMVDASIGGKTGIDLPKGKNLIGTFKRPLAVLVDPGYLATLPKSELLSGMAEVIKHAVIGDPLLFSRLENGPQGLSVDEVLLLRAVAVKVNVVQADPYENGLRAVLNFGHTIGHALETLSGYTIRHGEAVSIGMAAESKLAEQLGIISSEEVERIIELINRWALPVYHPLLENGDRLLSVIRYDKKHRQGKLRWALPYRIGKVDLVSGVGERVVKEAISSLVEAVHAG
ncbi:MAG: 3-dehydroquinate synthase [Thermanaerothrix sp.]|nr:3-dehydroquinate synthase [Thermanaerothrix sp.]